MDNAAMQLLYAVENILCMRGILQVEFTEKKGRLAAAGISFAGMLVFQSMVGFGENMVPVFLGADDIFRRGGSEYTQVFVLYFLYERFDGSGGDFVIYWRKTFCFLLERTGRTYTL